MIEAKTGIKPIGTYYNGYYFRSRLEARWAVFFDALGVRYEYEPIGLVKNGIRYLPDFMVRCHGCRGECGHDSFPLFIDVKGEMTELDGEKIKTFSYQGDLCEQKRSEHLLSHIPILVVGAIPPKGCSSDSSACGSYEDMNGIKGVYQFNYKHIDGDYFAAYPAADKNGRFYLWGDDSNYINRDDVERVELAYEKARQARFEYGEKPNVAR